MAASAAGLAATSSAQDLGSLTIEELMQLKVSTASRQAEPLSEIPAAIYVLTQEDIIRSGAETLPDMLRLVPGVQVGQIDANKFQVSIRGFGGRFTNKLQVLIDGRSIYNPLFSGVFWESNLVSPSEIERIEIIRGSGGALWGPNAINGIINIITKAPADTQGGSLRLGAGRNISGLQEAAYSGSLGEKGHFRILASGLQVSDLELPGGADSNDGWKTVHGGLRADWREGEKDTFSVNARFQKSDINESAIKPLLAPPYSTIVQDSKRGDTFSLASSWLHKHTDTEQSDLRAALSLFSGAVAPGIEFENSILDVGYTRAKSSRDSSRLLWGVGYRRYSDSGKVGNLNFLVPSSTTLETFSAFAQYERMLGPKVKGTFGLTAEHNEFTGIELQPSAKALYTPNEKESYWLSASRGVRTPNRGDTQFNVFYRAMPGQGLPVGIYVSGSENFHSEKLVALEAGARFRPTKDLYLDATAFYNSYSDLRAAIPGTPGMLMAPVPHIAVPVKIINEGTGRTGGLELSASYRPESKWRLDGSLSLFTDSINSSAPQGAVGNSFSIEGQGSTPRWQANLRASYQASKRLSINGSLMQVSSVKVNNLPEYTRFDLNLIYSVNDSLRLSLAGMDIFGARRTETVGSLYEIPSLTQRSWAMQASFKF